IYVTIKASGQKPLQDYFTAWVDTTNIASFIRSKRLGLESKFFNEVFVDNGSLRRELFSDLYDASIEQFKEKTKYTPYGALVNKAVEDENGLVKFETAVDNYLIDIFKNSKYDMFSVAPIAGYYVGQVTEIKVVKLVISCIKNNVDKQLLKQRLRELYA
ncbi:MAG: V-type ATPase subunit, partial [Clostridia bacterium]